MSKDEHVAAGHRPATSQGSPVMSSLRVGVASTFLDGTAMSTVTAFAKGLDERGFDSLWVAEHSHIPARTDWTAPSVAGQPPVPSEMFKYMMVNHMARMLDPFVVLTAAAAVTSRLRLGTAIWLAAEPEPIGAAKMVASLDSLSAGRLELGIGYGNWPEARNRGIDPSKRWQILREKILAMKAIWADEVASYDGTYVKVAECYSWPKPVQQPHPPILLGTIEMKWFPHLIEFCDGWIPNLTVYASEDDVRGRIRNLRQAAEESGRDPDTIDITAAVPSGRIGSSPYGIAGGGRVPQDLEEFRGYFRKTCLKAADVDYYASLGVNRVLTSPPTQPELSEAALDILAEELRLM